jgi:hypothetical protein
MLRSAELYARYSAKFNRQQSVSHGLSAIHHPTSSESSGNINTTKFHFYSKTSLFASTKNLLNLHNLFNLSSLKTNQLV